MKARLLAVSVILFASVTAAQSTDQPVDADPGWVKADSPIYGWEVALDNALASAGVISAADVAFERASEVSVARERNNSEAVENAVNQFNTAVSEADNRGRERLEQAESVLNNVSERVPEEAEFGISTALENVEGAKNRVPDRLTAPDNASRGVLDILPDGPGKDIETPAGDGR